MIMRIVELSCDHDGCDVAYRPSVEELTSVKLTRIGSTIAGWTRSARQDFCPEHRATTLISAIRQLAGQRLTDDQIADRLGVHRTTVQTHRAANGIPPGLGRTGRPSHGFAPSRPVVPTVGAR